MASYGDSLTFLYADGVGTTKEKPMGLHGLLNDTFTFYT
jgi:hypothetical protein